MSMKVVCICVYVCTDDVTLKHLYLTVQIKLCHFFYYFNQTWKNNPKNSECWFTIWISLVLWLKNIHYFKYTCFQCGCCFKRNHTLVVLIMKREITALKITWIRKIISKHACCVHLNMCICINATPYNNKTGKFRNFLVVNVNDRECEQYTIIAETCTVGISFFM